MNKHNRKPSSQAEMPEVLARIAHGARPFLLASFTALTVATPLLPSESAASRGTGVVLVALWWLLATAWLICGLLQGGVRVRGGLDLWAVLAFAVWQSLSAIAMANHGQPRATLNSLWVWLSLLLSYCLARQLLDTASQRRAIAVVMIALAAALSLHGFYQYFWSLPQTRQAFAKDPEKVLTEAGVDAPPGSPEREQFKNRVESTEPLATFALTNSLAGFLSGWLVVLIGLWLGRLRSAGSDRPGHWVYAVCVLLIAGCWVLTKSRTAWLATLTGLFVLGLRFAMHGRRVRVAHAVAAVGVAAAAAAFGILAGGLDRLVLTEALKSFSYRIEYWRATWAMVQTHPWFGCGPGNFQSYYTAFKLPGASETVADPHNFLLEIWATVGTPGLVAFLGIAFALCWLGRTRVDKDQDRPVEELRSVSRHVRPIYGGAIAGVLMAFIPCGYLVGNMPDAAVLFVALPATALVVLWHPWVQEGDLPRSVPAIAAATVLLNLLAAGGIGFPGVAGTVWLLAAITLNSSPTANVTRRLSQGVTGTIALVAMGLLMCCQYTVYTPVLRAGAIAERGMAEWSQGQMDLAERSLLEAAEVDPWSGEPWLSLASLRFQRWGRTTRAEDFAEFRDAATRMLDLNPRSSGVWAQDTEWLAAAYLRTRDAVHLKNAERACTQAISLYPNSAMNHARLALLHHWSKRRAAAASEAAIALELDALTPHQEQKLARRPPFPFRDSLDLPAGNTEQLMQSFRSDSGRQ